MIKELAVKLFGNIVRLYLEDYFDHVKTQLKQAEMRYSVKEYVSVALFLSLLTFMVVMLASSFFIAILTAYVFYSLTFSIIISFSSAIGAFFLVYYYPDVRGRNRQNRINKALPFTTIYMSTAASADVNPVELFKIVSMRGGELGKECQRIYRDMSMLGMDVGTAITKAADRTPSPRFAELLWGMLSVIRRGGSLGDYLSAKAKEFMDQYRRSLNDYSKQISFYTEIYITLIIVGTLFFIVLSSIMSPLVGGDILVLQTFLVFIFIPLISIAFIVLMKGLSPTE